MISVVVYDPDTGEILANLTCMDEDFDATQEANPTLHMLKGQASAETHKVDILTKTIVPKSEK